MATSTREAINEAVITRLKKVTAANGYDTDVQAVFGDEIPMGLDLDEFELPAILVITGDDVAEMKHKCRHGRWFFELQLWHNDVADATMDRFLRDVYKCLYADSPTAERDTAFRGMHPAIYDLQPLPIDPDLGMIEANRCYVANFEVHYQTKLWNL